MSDYNVEGLLMYVPLIAWIGVIAFLSSGKNSVSRTLPFFISIFAPILPKTNSPNLVMLYVIVRKICHFLGYAILALLASVAFIDSSVYLVEQWWYVLAFAVTLTVAAADEIRQRFEPGRVGSIGDIALDCAGGTTAIFLAWMFGPQ